MFKKITFLGLFFAVMGCSGAQQKTSNGFQADVFRDECFAYSLSLKASIPSQEYFTALFAVGGIYAVSQRIIEEDVTAAHAKIQHEEIEQNPKKVNDIKLARRCIKNWIALYNGQKISKAFTNEDREFVVQWGLYEWHTPAPPKKPITKTTKGAEKAICSFLENKGLVTKTPYVKPDKK